MIARGIAQVLVRDGSVLAQSDNFDEDSQPDRPCHRRLRPAGRRGSAPIACSPCRSRGTVHVVVASVSGRKFRLLILSPHSYNAIPDPFAIASRFPPSWSATGTLPAIEWPLEPLHPRRVAMLDTIFKQGDRPISSAAARRWSNSDVSPSFATSQHRVVPRTLGVYRHTRRQTWLATYAYAMTLSFGLVVLPMLPEGAVQLSERRPDPRLCLKAVTNATAVCRRTQRSHSGSIACTSPGEQAQKRPTRRTVDRMAAAVLSIATRIIMAL